MVPRRARLPIGQSDFREIRTRGLHFVDKTGFIIDALEANATVLLIPRPRRFGKTVNLSMLRYFLEKSGEDRSSLFDGLEVASSEAARPHLQRYPTIFVTLKDVKDSSWDQCFEAISELLATLYGEHRHLLSEGALMPEEAEVFTAILQRRATRAQCREALKELSRHLAEYHNEKVVILVDEYDTPIHAAFADGYYDHAISFFRGFLSGALKDNPHLFKGVLTGILRVAKESIFSGLNNLAVYSLLRTELSPYFGFTEEEVAELAEASGTPEILPELRQWYNGYIFGNRTIYNPWSVLSFLDSQDKSFRPYWVATSSNELIQRLLLSSGPDIARGLEALLQGGSLEKPIEENIVLRDLDQRPEALWSFLLFSGYLKITGKTEDDRGLHVSLTVPNMEVRLTYMTVFRHWMAGGLRSSDRVQALLSALLSGDAQTFEELLEQLILNTLSYHDIGCAPDGAPDAETPERVYQAFILALLVNLEGRYLVRSNREAGVGRYDVMILPSVRGQPGVVLELKVIRTRRGETPEQALDSALAQISDKDYSAELRAAGARPIHEVAAVFDGKRAWVRMRSADGA